MPAGGGQGARLYTSLVSADQASSEHAPAGKGGADSIPDNKVVQEPDIDQFQGRPDPARDPFVGCTGFGHAGWVIVGERCTVSRM